MNVNGFDKKNNEELLNKTSSFWKFLDDLAVNDPPAYADFMYKHKKTQSKMLKNTNNRDNAQLFDEFDKNIKIAKHSLYGINLNATKFYFTPIPFMVIKTKISETKTIVETLLNVNDYRNTMKKGQKLYVNLLESPYCKPLQSKSNNKISQKTPISDILIPIQVSAIIYEDDKCWRSDIIYHNSVYEHFNNNNNGNTCQLFKKWIIEFAFRQIEAQNSLKLLRHYKILKTKKFIGKTPPNPQFCHHHNKNKNKKTHKIETKCEEKIVAKIDTNENIFNDDTEKKMDIIEKKSYLIPKYTLNIVMEKKKVIKIVIEMEKDNDIKDIALDMNDYKLSLKSLHYKLNIVFPMKVNDNDIKAKFDKKKHCLKLKLPIAIKQ